MQQRNQFLYIKYEMLKLKETFDKLGREFEPAISQFCVISV